MKNDTRNFAKSIEERVLASRIDIRKHNLRKPVRNTILRSAEYNGNSRIAVFDNNKICDPEKSQENLGRFYDKEQKSKHC